MKKLLIVAILVTSISAFGEDGSAATATKKNAPHKMDMSNSMQNSEKLTPESQIKLEEIRLNYLKKVEEIKLDIKKVELDIDKEMLSEKVDTKKIGKLIDKKTDLQSKMNKNMVNYQIEVKEKLGINLPENMKLDHNKKMNSMMGHSNNKCKKHKEHKEHKSVEDLKHQSKHEENVVSH